VFPVLERADALAPPGSNSPGLDLEALGAHEGRMRLFAAVRDLFAHLQSSRPLVVVIDDMQWADADSLALLSALLRPPDAPALLLLMTARGTHDDGGAPFGLPGDVRAITLPRLSPAEALELARARLAERGRADERLAQAIAEEAAGHPLFLDELARHAQSARGLVAARVSLDDVYAARIDHLAPGPRRLLEVLSVAGIPLRPSAVMRAADVASADYAALVRTLRIGHLARTVARDGVEALEVYHDRVRDAVCHRLDDAARRTHHERVARALEAGARQDDDALAAQWLAAGDTARALHYTMLAADAAYRSLAFDHAARLYEAALRLADEPRGEAALSEEAAQLARTRLAEANASLGRVREAARAYEAAAGHAKIKAQALDLRRRQAEALFNCGAFGEGEAVMDEVLAAVGLRPDRSRLAALTGFLAGRARLWWRGLDFVERPEASVPPRTLTRLDACAGISGLLGPLDVIRSSDFQTKTLLFALEAGEPSRVLRALALDAPIMAGRGAGTKAKTEETLARAEALAARRGLPQEHAFVLVSRGFTDFLQGDFRPAYTRARSSVAVLREHARHAFFEMRSGELVTHWALAWLGELGELAARLEPFLAAADARGDLYGATTMRLGPPSIAALRTDDPVRARAAMKQASAKWAQPGYHTPHYWSTYAEAQVDLYEGDGHAAWTRIAEAWPKMRASMMFQAQVILLEASFLRARAALAAAVQHPPLEGAMLRAARRDARTLASSDAPYGPPLARVVRASIDVIEGREERAREPLQQAVTELEAVGMRLHAEAARWRLGHLRAGGEGRPDVETAEAWARTQGIENPARMFGMIAPGFAVSAAARPRLGRGG
jgi:tetratricopeptide (TPR) repeat protein